MNTAPNISIRRASANDAALVLDFIRQLARYEKLENECVATEQQVRESLFGPNSRAEALLAFEGEAAAGFAVYFFSYSTFLAKPGLYLEDLFVQPDRRGRGIGKRIFAELLHIARKHDCGRFEWAVLDWNAPSIAFYERLGAQAQPEWIKYRLDEAQISRLALSGTRS